MQVVVKKPHIRVEGDITGNLVEYLRREFNDIEIIRDEDEELVEIRKSDWYRSIRRTISPGENVRIYRELHRLTQKELGERLGNLSRQNISNIENNRRPISKAVARKLADMFDVSIEKFL
ncbi:MAG: helix-turn-helix domain-containing protein [Deltaproteobacteria bacterium]|nr:helix-turn-helix domain-containing protein [Deltaproteobacteria bacterium]